MHSSWQCATPRQTLQLEHGASQGCSTSASMANPTQYPMHPPARPPPPSGGFLDMLQTSGWDPAAWSAPSPDIASLSGLQVGSPASFNLSDYVVDTEVKTLHSIGLTLAPLPGLLANCLTQGKKVWTIIVLKTKERNMNCLKWIVFCYESSRLLLRM